VSYLTVSFGFSDVKPSGSTAVYYITLCYVMLASYALSFVFTFASLINDQCALCFRFIFPSWLNARDSRLGILISALMPLTHIREVQCSNLGPVHDTPSLYIVLLSFYLSCKVMLLRMIYDAPFITILLLVRELCS
jgi:hypothetical protein